MKKFYSCLLIFLEFLSSTPETVNGYEVNLARGGHVIQSSTYLEHFAENGVDGNPDTTCFETIVGSDPWWRLDLRDVYCVSRVIITNRLVCCSDFIKGAEIRIGNSLENNGNNNPLCAVISAIPAGESNSYSCNGLEGRYVNVFLPGSEQILTLCELEVYKADRCVKRSMVKMKFSSSADLTDTTVRNNLLKQLETALDNKGLKNVTVLWSQVPKKEVITVKNVKPCSGEK
ncbi:fucolectin-like [Paramisgurnus dabryanus]|uniref:fucolectin-like n=1 Tax=Paramisgurnus dabryanus TaxID=90735 RepID=UPI0031F44389